MSRPSNDEYIDYSCSTSVERLARDVETLLRKWHVDQGSDRHVSVRSKHSNFHSSKSNSSIHSLSTSGSNSISSNNKGKTTTIDTIRSAVIEWNISFHHPTNGERISSSDIALDLVLWDAPSEMSELTAGGTRNGTEEYEGSEQAGLPFSLRRRQGVDLPFQGSVLDNFSTIFGIGQHITLSPKQPEALDPALVDFLSRSVISRHDSATIAGQVMTGVLTGFLPSALNTAACFCGCRFPLIGVWGHYQPSPDSSTSTFPPWLQSFDQSTAHKQQRYNSSRRRHGHRNQHYMPPVITGSLRAEDCRATFWCNVLAADKKWVESVQWSKWGNVLLSHCRHTTHEDSVHLWAARHVYSWFKPTESRGFIQSFLKTAGSDWRGDERHGLRNSAPEDVETYRQECRNVAIWLLEQAARTSTTNPMWGPTENPVASLHASLTWNSPTVKNSTERLPLVSLPLKTRLPPEDRKEMEMAIASSIFETSNPSHFSFQCYFAPPEASLAATQRCVLAALVRASTLPRETLLLHVMDKNVIAGWDSEAGNRIAAALATRASLDDATHSLVKAMDWKNAMESIIDHVDAEERVLEALDGRLSLEFPSPPDQIATSRDDWKALLKSAPPGRLLSLLFVQMAHVRTPSSMALMWKSFVEELRQRWERQESLPNMQFVPGLDPPGDSYVAKRCFSTVGSKAAFASQVHCSEPDPDDGNCLIGQKLQVFNICIETSLVEDMKEIEKMENKRQKLDGPQSNPRGSGSPKGNLGESIIDRLPDGHFSPRGGDDATITSCTTGKSLATNRFFDADEGSIPFVEADGTPSVGGLQRKGARCPVYGASLLKTGDQLYAPYLQRPFPLTDDVITQRQLMMNRQKGAKASTTVKQRIEIAQRLQRPKLFSDMQAFKAANPGAVFQDFVSWYVHWFHRRVGKLRAVLLRILLCFVQGMVTRTTLWRILMKKPLEIKEVQRLHQLIVNLIVLQRQSVCSKKRESSGRKRGKKQYLFLQTSKNLCLMPGARLK